MLLATAERQNTNTTTHWNWCRIYFEKKFSQKLLVVRLSLSVSCVSPPLVPIFGQFLFLSSFVIISSQPCVFSWLVPSPVLLIILLAPSFPSLYKSSVFPVSWSSINVILVCTCSPAISMFPNKVFKRSSTPPRSWHPRTSVTEYWTTHHANGWG